MKRLKQIHDCLISAGAQCIRELKTPNHDDTLEWWSVNGKVVIIQYWGKHDCISCFRHVQDKNDMNAEIKALDEYINF